MLIMAQILREVKRCPQCGVAYPTLEQVWCTDETIDLPEYGGRNKHYRHWALYKCTSCTKLIMAEGYSTSTESRHVANLYPSIISIEDELPPAAKRYLEQTMESLNAPDGAAMLSGSAVDQMLKAKGLKEGSVYARIEQAVKDGLITEDMGEWAHRVRLGANRPRHADVDNPHVSQAEAEQSVSFARMLGHIMFVLPERVKQGKQAASEASCGAEQTKKQEKGSW